MNNPADWLWLVVPALVAVLWIGVMHLAAWIGGWSRLADAYQFRGPFDGYRKRFVSGELTGYLPCNYGGCLTLGANPLGLYVAVVPPLRPGHPPLFIPWSDITATIGRRWLVSYAQFNFRAARRVRLRVAKRVAEQLISNAGAADLPVLQAAD